MLAHPITRLLILLVSAASLEAQRPCAAVPIIVGSEWERYVRIAQSLGDVALQPWTVRPIGPRQQADLVPSDSLPWRAERLATQLHCARDRFFFVLPPKAQIIYNASFPLGWNDAAVWSGRGVTTVLEGGVGVSAGLFSLRLAPLFFASLNAPFALRPNGLSGQGVYADWRSPDEIDVPQRFGSSTYSRLDAGQSELRIDISRVAFGFSTGNEYWGPASDNPIVLGNNAAGFPKVFLGTSQPQRIWRLGRVHGRAFYGSLGESAFSPLRDSGFARLASGVAAVFQPDVLPGLEIGASRFFHVLQTDGLHLDAREIARPFGVLFKANRSSEEEPENQIASAFARLVFPASGLELYGEFGREDHNWDLKELWQFLDHDSAYLLGGRKAWRDGTGITLLRAEVLNSRVTHLALASTQAPMYVHTVVRQGHTNRGQALGSVAGHSGGGSVLAIEHFDPRGRISFSWERLQFGDVRGSAPPDPFSGNITHVWRVNRLRFGQKASVEIGGAAVYDINRTPGSDSWSAQMTLAISRDVTR